MPDNIINLHPETSSVERLRLFRMIEALGDELGRQGVAEAMTLQGFDLTALARVALGAADQERKGRG